MKRLIWLLVLPAILSLGGISGLAAYPAPGATMVAPETGPLTKAIDEKRRRQFRDSRRGRNGGDRRNGVGARMLGGPYWGYGPRWGRNCDDCRARCADGSNNARCRRCRTECQ